MELLLLFPIVHRIKRYFWIFAILSGLSMRFLSGYTDEISNEILKSHIYFITYYYCAFIIGVTFARYSIFEWLCRELGNNRVAYFLFLLSIIGICFVIRIKIDFTFITFIIVPFFIYAYWIVFRKAFDELMVNTSILLYLFLATYADES